ncbi:MAG: translation initiation factor IF-2 subunit gamma [Promethearchaeota archaeon]|nr:MAG: translation initiation factor IF-2 subunit gamma [Candidatus Lokiarchaeota archaeon]
MADKSELEDITKISGIGKATQERLKAAGIDTVDKLANLKPEDLTKIKGIGSSTASAYIQEAKNLLETLGKSKEATQEQPEKPSEPKPKKEKEIKKKKKKKPRKEISNAELEEKMKKQAEMNLGLVGHVDHGKTTLVKALTGDWTDRHSEEQERGISIKLGYSNATILYCPECEDYLTLHMAEEARKKGQPRYRCPECGTQLEFKRNISFVDAPGHEILMATMLSGASLMDGACLLIAANEKCPQPQTREHLAALNIANIENIIIIQNKIDAVSEEEGKQNYQEIKEFTKGTVAENAPIIPISAIFGVNIKYVVKAIEDIIPTPELDESEEFQFLVARSFDVNKPGTEIDKLIGGVIGGSVLKGKVEIGDNIEIKPGIKSEGKYKTLMTNVVSISQGNVFKKSGTPGGLIGLGTNLDPALTKGDALIGNLVGREDTLPELIEETELEVHLFDRVIGTEEMIEVHELKHGEKLLIVVGTEKISGVVSKILKNSYIIKLNPPVCIPDDEDIIFAISRIINRRYRLIGYGIRVG